MKRIIKRTCLFLIYAGITCSITAFFFFAVPLAILPAIGVTLAVYAATAAIIGLCDLIGWLSD